MIKINLWSEILTGVVILMGVCAAVLVFLGLPWVCGRLLRVLLGKRAKRLNALVLTFDDGPGTKLTPSILDMLKRYDIKASFFLLGQNIQGRQDIVKRMAAEGHDVFSHGQAHLNHWKALPFSALTDIRRGWGAIDGAVGIQHGKYPFRPPKGKMNLLSMMYLFFRRVPIIYWTLDMGDTRLSKVEQDSQALAVSAQNAGGGVVLAHDYDRSDSSFATFILESIQGVLEMAKQNGMHVMPVSEFLNGTKLQSGLITKWKGNES